MDRMLNANRGDIVIRYTAFYISLAAYFVLLPIILSYSLGYHIDYHKLRIYKMGILSLRSAPSGASIYINGKVRQDITPARIEELKPGTYAVEVKREGFYPWQKELAIRPNMVTRAENIILFPKLQDIEEVGSQETVNFVITDNKNQIYHMTKSGLYRSNIDGTNSKKLSFYSDWPGEISGKKFSPDGKKFLYFNENRIWVVRLIDRDLVKDDQLAYVEEALRMPGTIKDVFWHSDSHHIVFVANKEINVIELGSDGEEDIVTLHKCNSRPRGLFYDVSNDSLYFNDTVERQDRLYRLDLREKFFDKLMQRVKKEFDIIYEQK